MFICDLNSLIGFADDKILDWPINVQLTKFRDGLVAVFESN
jgi:hypothetical protein